MRTVPGRWLDELELDAVWRSDVVVVGSGVAGLGTALSSAPRSVTLITKTALGAGSSLWAQGGIAAAWGSDDASELHAADTRRVGRGLNDPETVRLLAEEGPASIRRLLDWGVVFDRDAKGNLALGQEAGHRRRRILHAGGDATGAELVRALREAVRQDDRVRLCEETFVVDLILAGDRVAGVLGVQEGRWVAVLGEAVVLATGGAGQLFWRTTNPPEVTGDGLALAARAGAALADLEFVQFHPTALSPPSQGQEPSVGSLPLLTEALRGDGALVVDRQGRRFLLDEHPDAELAPRDVVAQACWRQDQRGGAFLDLRPLGTSLPHRFPTVVRACLAAGFDPLGELIPITPAAHYHVGGILTDVWGRTTLAGLWACGETAATGVHGANRLASNSLLEGLVFSRRVARASAAARVGGSGRLRIPSFLAKVPGRASAGPALAARVRRLMWQQVGLEREASGLRFALAALADLKREVAAGWGEVTNLLLAAELVTASALERRESRGAHRRLDFPETSPELERRLLWLPHRGGSGGAFAFQPDIGEELPATGERAS